MVDTAEPRELRGILEGFRDEIAAATDQRERVGIELVRGERLRNEAVTARGLAVTIDEPVAFGGQGEWPDPAEQLLAAAAASLSVTLTVHAALRGITLDAVAASASAAIDGHAFFHPGEGEPGLLDLAIALRVRAPLARPAFDALLAEVLQVVPVLRTLRQMPKIMLEYEDSR